MRTFGVPGVHRDVKGVVMIPNQILSPGPFVFAGVFIALGLLLLLFVPIIIIVVSNRAEPDGRGVRPFTVYLFGMSYFTLNLAYAGLTLVVTALLSFIGPHFAPIGNSVAQEVVLGGLLLVIAGGTLVFHLRQGVAAARGDGRIDGPNARVLHSYIGVVSFIYVVTAMLSLGVVIYLIFQLAGPGVFGTLHSNTKTLNVLLDFVYLLVVSSGIVAYMWRMAPPGMLRMPTMPHVPTTATTPPAPPTTA
jgi:hypothetical protein